MAGMDLLAWVCDSCQAVLPNNLPHKNIDQTTCHGPVRIVRFIPSNDTEFMSAVRVVPESRW